MSRRTMPPHPFRPDPEYPHPADQKGNRVCLCGLVGQPGDGHHTMPAPVVDAQALAAGERGDP